MGCSGEKISVPEEFVSVPTAPLDPLPNATSATRVELTDDTVAAPGGGFLTTTPQIGGATTADIYAYRLNDQGTPTPAGNSERDPARPQRVPPSLS